MDPKPLTTQAKVFVEKHRENIDYLSRFGSPIEKALVSKVMELAAEA